MMESTIQQTGNHDERLLQDDSYAPHAWPFNHPDLRGKPRTPVI